MGNSSDKLFWDFVKSTYISRLKKGTACIERSASRPMPNYASYALKICLLAAALKYKPASVPGGTLLAVASRSASFLSDKKRKVSSAKSRLRGVQCTTPSLISTFDLVETEKPAALCNDPTSTCIMETSLERESKEDTQTDDRSCFKAESPCQPAIDLMKTRKEKKKEIKMKPLICTDQSQNDDTSCFKTENQNCSHQPQAEAIELSKAEIYKNIDRQRKPIADTNETDTTTYPKVQCLTSYTSIDAIQIGFENISSHQKFSFSPEAIQNEDWEYYTEQPIQNVKNSKKNTTDTCDTIAMVSIEDLKEGSESRITPVAVINDACPVSEKDINKKKTCEIKFSKVLEMAARPVVHKVPMMLEQTEKKENIESINQRWSDQDKSSKVNCPAKNDDTNLTNIKNINSGTLSSSELDLKQIKIKTNLRKRHANTDISDDPIKKVKDSNMKNSTYTDKWFL